MLNNGRQMFFSQSPSSVHLTLQSILTLQWDQNLWAPLLSAPLPVEQDRAASDILHPLESVITWEWHKSHSKTSALQIPSTGVLSRHLEMGCPGRDETTSDTVGDTPWNPARKISKMTMPEPSLLSPMETNQRRELTALFCHTVKRKGHWKQSSCSVCILQYFGERQHRLLGSWRKQLPPFEESQS